MDSPGQEARLSTVRPYRSHSGYPAVQPRLRLSASSRAMARLHVILTGRVQGVGFRFFALGEAHRRGLTGWVRNKGQRQVEVLAEGTEERLQSFLESLRAGPVSSRVDSEEVSWPAATGEFTTFEARANSY